MLLAQTCKVGYYTPETLHPRHRPEKCLQTAWSLRHSWVAWLSERAWNTPHECPCIHRDGVYESPV